MSTRSDVPARDEALVRRLLDGAARQAVRLLSDGAGGWRMRLFSAEPLPLSGVVRVVESFDLAVLSEQASMLAAGDRGSVPVQLHDVAVSLPPGVAMRAEPLATLLEHCFAGRLERERLNALALHAAMDLEDLTALRALRRCHRQLYPAMSGRALNVAMLRNPDAAAALLALLDARFAPDHEVAEPEAAERFAAARRAVARHDDDRLLASLAGLARVLVRSTHRQGLRTHDGQPLVVYKFAPRRLSGLHGPQPAIETFVYAAGVEGAHLRGGPVARGGLRWSDRPEDYRAEVLGLYRAQVRKNALILPTGAKGAFVLKGVAAPGADDVERAYRTFVRGLLAVTDRAPGQAPAGVAHDGPDPYLVVAADRGTAALSDTANEVAREAGHWLGDAFASGGSNGYSHKALGVTARGAWLAVRHHFRALGIDVRTDPITVVGIGDMSGDVFGNGMLRSRALRLVAAFDHRHVFLDPDPDPETAYRERERLFALPRSSWADYSPEAISEGGGVHPRDARSIPLSPQVRQLLRMEAEEVSPPELIRALLSAPVDLLYAGGIGTYVRADDESDADAADPANDDVRIEAGSLRARVVVEGANLALTQRARIRYARRGGRCYQDAIDNAAGVATSDREVNLKILLDHTGPQAERVPPEQRAAVMRSVTGEVVGAVLTSVDRQLDGLEREARRGAAGLAGCEALLSRLEAAGRLDRRAEALPTSEEVRSLAELGAALPRPVQASLTALAKQELADAILSHDGLDAGWLDELVRAYFPAGLPQNVLRAAPAHPLRRELLATTLANDTVDRLGAAFCADLAAETGCTEADAALAQQQAAGALDFAGCEQALREHRDRTGEPVDEHLDTLLGVQAQVVRRLLPPSGDAGAVAASLRELVELVVADPASLPDGSRRAARLAALVESGLPEDVARRVVTADLLGLLPLPLRVARATGTDLDLATSVVGGLAVALPLPLPPAFAAGAGTDAPWARRQRRGLAEDAEQLLVDAAVRCVTAPGGAGAGLRAVIAALRPHMAALREAAELCAPEPDEGVHALAVALRDTRRAFTRATG